MPKEIEESKETVALELDETKIYIVGADFCGYTTQMLDLLSKEDDKVREKFMYVQCDGGDEKHPLCTSPLGNGYPHFVMAVENKPSVCHTGYTDVNSVLEKCTT